MINISFVDWFLTRSDGFKLMAGKLRDHKMNTQRSFSKVKRAHFEFVKKFDEHDKRIRQIEKMISDIYEPTMIKKKK